MMMWLVMGAAWLLWLALGAVLAFGTIDTYQRETRDWNNYTPYWAPWAGERPGAWGPGVERAKAMRRAGRDPISADPFQPDRERGN